MADVGWLMADLVIRPIALLSNYCTLQFQKMSDIRHQTSDIRHQTSDILIYTANEVPQPQVLLALGLVNVKPRLFKPPCQSTSIP